MKNYKTHTLHHIFNQEAINPDWLYYGYFYEDDEDDDSYPYNYSYDHIMYDYLPLEEVNVTYLQRYGWRHSMRTMNINPQMIDMMSIYSKEMMRQKKIEQILGENSESIPNTIENITKIK